MIRRPFAQPELGWGEGRLTPQADTGQALRKDSCSLHRSLGKGGQVSWNR